MNPATFERFSTVIAERNAEEIARRTEYHKHFAEGASGDDRATDGWRVAAGRWVVAQLGRRLVAAGRPRGEPESLDEFLLRYASLATWGKPVAEEVLTAIQPATPIPVDLVTFYRRQGSLPMSESLCNLSIFSLDALRSAQTPQHPYARFHSMGLADSINRVWGNAPELDPVGDDAAYTQEELDRLNGDYQAVAVWNDADSPSEAHFYIYFDHTQRFGIVHRQRMIGSNGPPSNFQTARCQMTTFRRMGPLTHPYSASSWSHCWKQAEPIEAGIGSSTMRWSGTTEPPPVSRRSNGANPPARRSCRRKSPFGGCLILTLSSFSDASSNAPCPAPKPTDWKDRSPDQEHHVEWDSPR